MCKIITTNADAAAVAQFLFCLTSVWLRAVEADAEQVDPFGFPDLNYQLSASVLLLFQDHLPGINFHSPSA